MARQFADRFEQQIWAGGADALSGGEWTKDADRADSGAARHFDVFGGIAYVDALFGACAKALQCEVKRGGMWLFAGGVFAEHKRGEKLLESKAGNLLADAIAAAAGYQTELKSLRQPMDYAARPGKQLGTLCRICRPPQLVSLAPFRAWNAGRAIDFVPVGAVMLLEFGFTPTDFERAEHRHVCAGISSIGIEQGTVPIEQDYAGAQDLDFFWRTGHKRRIVAEMRALPRDVGRSQMVKCQEALEVIS